MWRITTLLVLVLLVALPLQAKPNKAKKSKAAQQTVAEQPQVDMQEKFSPAERNLIRAHLLSQKENAPQKGNQNLPPGLQKKVARGKALPPGWQKKVSPGESLDYQVYRQGDSLPDILLRRLPPPPVGSEILQVENQIIRLNSATRTILDVFDLAPSR
jgi:hypothetical protein